MSEITETIIITELQKESRKKIGSIIAAKLNKIDSVSSMMKMHMYESDYIPEKINNDLDHIKDNIDDIDTLINYYIKNL